MALDYSRLGKKRILVVEDMEMNQFIAKHIMCSWGFEVAIAANGLQAVKMVEENTYDLILMDIQMPVMDGIAATKHIRSLRDPVKANIPIVALSANMLKHDSELYLSAGMTDCLSKPIIEETLFRVIASSVRAAHPEEPVHAAPATVTSVPAEKLYDLSIIQSVSGGDVEFVKKMVLLFIETVPANIRELSQYTAGENWEMASKMAHKLKATLDSMGIHTLRQVTRTIEANARNRQLLDEIPALVQQLCCVVSACVRQLEVDVLDRVS